MQTYTFVCLTARQASTAIDIACLPQGQVQTHARGLLARHASAHRIEVWGDADLIAVVERRADAGSEPADSATTTTRNGPGGNARDAGGA